MNFSELKDFLDVKADQFNRPDFIAHDPIQIPHRFSAKEDIEIAGFLTAIISWGNRKSILASATKILDFMGNSPHDFILNFKESDLENLKSKAIHRTFNGDDFLFFLKNLHRIYIKGNNLEDLFLLKPGEPDFYHSIERFRTEFLLSEPEHRSKKHLSSTYKNSAAKRLMIFLRWMVRHDKRGVDFGIWKKIDPRFLSVPLDVHTGNVSRQLGIVFRKQNDWKTVQEMDAVLRKMNPDDPAQYDFALFGLGISDFIKK